MTSPINSGLSRVALVTGGSRGIGRAIALQLAADGMAVVVNYAGDADSAAETVATITSAGGRATAVQADISDAPSVRRLFADSLTAFGRLDVVVNSAGVMPMARITSDQVDAFDKVIATNLRGAFLVLAEAAQHVAAGGRIIALSTSVIALSPRPTVRTSRRRRALKGWCACSPTNCVDVRSR